MKRQVAGGFTITEAVVSVALLAMVLTGAIQAYSSFDRASDDLRAKSKADLFARYLFDSVNAYPPESAAFAPNGSDPFYLEMTPVGKVTYSSDPNKKDGETGFFPGETPNGSLSHEIRLVGTESFYGTGISLYRISATYDSRTKTVYLQK